MFGVMIDCSRNAVMKPASVKQFVSLIAKMGYHTFMLYTEDTYEVENQPYFGHLRGRYTKEELKEIDAHCQSEGVELIPCIQTLAHLPGIFRWTNVYGDVRDCQDILLVEEEKTYQLIEDMIVSLSECVSSRKFHIGMDEAYWLGFGNYLKKHGHGDRYELISRHLHRVCDIAKKYGMQTMVWSDMFCKLALNREDYRKAKNVDVIKEKPDLPDNVILVHWDYSSLEYDCYQNMFRLHKAFQRPVVYAGGAWTWGGFIADNQLAIDAAIPAYEACQEEDVEHKFFTIWGDDGGECSRFAALPAMFYIAELERGNKDKESIKANFKEKIGMEFDDFMLLDALDAVDTHDFPKGEARISPSKYLLYNDPFLGLHDHTVTGTENQYYGDLATKIESIAVAQEYQGLFDYAKALCDALSVKSELGVRTRKAYLQGDKAKLKEVAETEYESAIKKIQEFHKVYQQFWMQENKPFGFEVQDIRLGGLLQRLRSCQERIMDYCSGKISSIPELEQPVLCEDQGYSWERVVTPNLLTQALARC